MIPEMTRGIHKIPDAMYFDLDLPSSSTTRVLMGQPNARLAWDRDHPRESTDAFAVGAYLHALLLDPESIDTGFVRLPKLDRRTTAGRTTYDEFHARANRNGSRIITPDQVALAQSMSESVLRHTGAANLLQSATHREITAIGDIGGRAAKAKIDAVVVADSESVIIDIKTTQSASLKGFAKSAAEYGYYHQAAWYSRIASQVICPVSDVIIIAVEKDAPHLCAVYRIPQHALISADIRLEKLAQRWWDVRGGDNTGYPTEITDLEPPSWWLAQTEPSY